MPATEVLPFVRPTIAQEDLDAVAAVLKTGWLASGPRVLEFERALETYVGGAATVRVLNSGTSALEACLVACDIGPGDEVIVPAMSFVATANVVVRCGATPVFVDVDLETRNLRVEAVARALTPRTRAVMPVHFAGLAVEMEPIRALAKQHQLRVIEDAAHAIGTCEAGGTKTGARGDLICYSFHPNKNITTIEGGAVACFDAATVKRLERIRFHGIQRDAHGEMDVPEWGGKMNMPDVHAALGLVQLPRLDGWIAARNALAGHYRRHLPHHPCLAPPAYGEGHAWHIYAVRVDFQRLGVPRYEFIERLKRHGIAAGVHYPAMHQFSLYRHYGYTESSCPNAAIIGAQTLSLPMFPAMTEADVERACTALAAVLKECGDAA